MPNTVFQVPYHLKDSDLGDRWECRENIWDPMYASCTVRQALSDEQIDAILESCQEVEEQGDNRRIPETMTMSSLLFNNMAHWMLSRECEREEGKHQGEGEGLHVGILIPRGSSGNGAIGCGGGIVETGWRE